MPSIEIACIDLTVLLEPPPASFSIAHELGLRSHRTPKARFEVDFAQLSGSLYHLGNPGLDPGGGPFFASELLSEAALHGSAGLLEFAPQHEASARQFIAWLLASSPSGNLLFTSDYQFGPENAARFSPMGPSEFWRRHDSRELLLNAAYPIKLTV